MKNKAWFYLSWAYFLKTRISSTFKLVSWVFIYVVPTAVISLSLRTACDWTDVLAYILQFAIIYNFYEIGYIENDNETTKKEKDPTERLNEDEKQYYEQHKKYIYTFRLALGFLLLALLGYLEQFSAGFICFAVSILLILLVYLVYNRIRNLFTLPLHFILVCLRFLSYIFLGSLYLSTIDLFFLVLLYPVINIIERASNPKFKYPMLAPLYYSERKSAWFRMTYYVTILLVIFVLNTFQVSVASWIFALYIYFAIYRFLGLLYILKNKESV